MATAVAQKIEFADQADRPFQQDGLAPIHAPSRAQALHHMMAGRPATFDQGVDPQIYRAASGLIERHSAGRPVDIEAYGYPFDVLENVATQLESIDASQYVTAQVMGALQEYIVTMGSEFSRAAKAKPLYARIMVTDREPDDLPECEQTQAAFLDGVRKVGGEAARINVQNTVFGTKSTTSQGVDLNAMFASKSNGLFVFFGSPTNEGIGGFDSVDAALVNLAQGMGGVGGGAGGAPAQAVEEIKQAIKNGEVTPQTLKLIENLAAMAQIADAMKTPGALANAPAQMADVVRAITQQIQTGVAEGTISAAVLQGTAAVITNMQDNAIVQAVLTSPEGAKALIVADNDNAAPVAVVAADNDNTTIAKQIETITAQLVELAAADTTPPEARAQIEAQIADITQAMDAPDSAQIQAALASAAQTVATIDTPAAEAVAATIDAAAIQIQTVPQAMDAVVASAALSAPATTEIADLPVAEIKELIAVLQKADALPPALAEAVQKIDLQNMAPEKIADALQGKGESAPAVQAMVVALADPAVQTQLPAQTLSAVNIITARAPDVSAPAAVVSAPMTSFAAPAAPISSVSAPPTTTPSYSAPESTFVAAPAATVAPPPVTAAPPTPSPPAPAQPPKPTQHGPAQTVPTQPPKPALTGAGPTQPITPPPPRPAPHQPPTNGGPNMPPAPPRPAPHQLPTNGGPNLPPAPPLPGPTQTHGSANNPAKPPTINNGPEGAKPGEDLQRAEGPRDQQPDPRPSNDQRPTPSNDLYQQPTTNANLYGNPANNPVQPGQPTPPVVTGPIFIVAPTPSTPPIPTNGPDDKIVFTKPTGCGGVCPTGCGGCSAEYNKAQAKADNLNASAEYAAIKQQRNNAPSNQPQ